MSKIAMILELLGDGKWHRIEELQQTLGLNEHKVKEVTTFLNEYAFVQIDEKHGKVKINRDFQKLLAQTVI